MSEVFETYLHEILDFGISVIIAIIILVIGKVIIKLICNFLNRCFERSSLEMSISKFLLSAIKIVLYIILIIILCETIGIKTTSFVAILGSAGLAVGLSLQGSLSNFAGGVLILITKPFVIGDYIISSPGEGVVDRIDIFYTTLITFDNKKVMIPNGTLSDEPVTNLSAFPKRRVDIFIGISYDSDIKKAREIILELIEKHPLVLDDGENMVAVTELGDNQVNLCVKAWTNTEDYWTVKYDLNEQIKNAFDEAGIEIPFKQVDVYIKNDSKYQRK